MSSNFASHASIPSLARKPSSEFNANPVSKSMKGPNSYGNPTSDADGGSAVHVHSVHKPCSYCSCNSSLPAHEDGTPSYASLANSSLHGLCGKSGKSPGLGGR